MGRIKGDDVAVLQRSKCSTFLVNFACESTGHSELSLFEQTSDPTELLIFGTAMHLFHKSIYHS